MNDQSPFGKVEKEFEGRDASVDPSGFKRKDLKETKVNLEDNPNTTASVPQQPPRAMAGKTSKQVESQIKNGTNQKYPNQLKSGRKK